MIAWTRHGSVYKDRIFHDIHALRRFRAESVLKAFRDAIKRHPRSEFNDERRAIIERLECHSPPLALPAAALLDRRVETSFLFSACEVEELSAG